MPIPHDSPGAFNAKPVEWPVHPALLFVVLPLLGGGFFVSLGRLLDAFAAAWVPGAVPSDGWLVAFFVVVALLATSILYLIGGY